MSQRFPHRFEERVAYESAVYSGCNLTLNGSVNLSSWLTLKEDVNLSSRLQGNGGEIQIV